MAAASAETDPLAASDLLVVIVSIYRRIAGDHLVSILVSIVEARLTTTADMRSCSWIQIRSRGTPALRSLIMTAQGLLPLTRP